MARRAGSADLPLHGGHVPKWLADRMTRLGAVISEAIVHHYGRDELLRRHAHPFWFQSFGAVMGMDWHSSGITTSFVGAIDGLGQGEIINLTNRRAAPSRRMQLDILQSLGPDGIARECRGMEARDQEPAQSPRTEQPLLPHLIMPAHHEVRPSDVF